MAQRGKRSKSGRSSGGGALSGFRSGFKKAVGTGGNKKKESPLSQVLTYLLLAAVVGILIYRVAHYLKWI